MRKSLIVGVAVILTGLLAATAFADVGAPAPPVPGTAQPTGQVAITAKFVNVVTNPVGNFDMYLPANVGIGTPPIVVAHGNFNPTLRTLQTEGRVQLIINEPRITLRNDESGEVDFTSTLPYAPGSQAESPPPTITLPGTLKVTPHFNDDGTFTLALDLKVPDGVGFVGGLPAEPVATFRDLTTKVTLQDGETLAIEGLPRLNNQGPDTYQYQLIIFITPTLVRPA
jgi:type II secretory pathway component GspD/PulD (secretin)